MHISERQYVFQTGTSTIHYTAKQVLHSECSHQGSPQRIFHLHLVLSSTSSSITSTTTMSSLTASINLLNRPYPFLLSQFHPLHPSSIYPSHFLHVCPNHRSLASRSCCLSKPSHLPRSSDVLSTELFLTKIVTCSTLPPPSPLLHVFSATVSTTLLVALPHCTPSATHINSNSLCDSDSDYDRPKRDTVGVRL